ncbi:MAG: hypothetical protein ACM3VW_01785, partial [Bacteroidota bacterium]
MQTLIGLHDYRHLHRPPLAFIATIALLLIVSVVFAQPAANTPCKWTLETAVLNTAAQAWDLAGRNQDQYAAIIQSMVGLVASSRGITIPDSREVGQKIGNMIARDAKADPDELLYAIVDHAVMMNVPRAREPMVPTALQQAPEPALTDALTATVTEAWNASGCSMKGLQATVNQMTALVLQNRGLTISDTK